MCMQVHVHIHTHSHTHTNTHTHKSSAADITETVDLLLELDEPPNMLCQQFLSKCVHVQVYILLEVYIRNVLCLYIRPFQCDYLFNGFPDLFWNTKNFGCYWLVHCPAGNETNVVHVRNTWSQRARANCHSTSALEVFMCPLL